MDAQTITSSLKRMIQNFVGEVGVLSFTGKNYEPIESGTGIKAYGVHFIVKTDPTKSIRVVFNSRQQPLSIHIWKNFGFDHSEMRKPEQVIEITDDDEIDDVVYQAAGILTKGGGGGQINESVDLLERYSELNDQQRAAWKTLRKQIKQISPSQTKSQLIKTYLPQAKRIGVSNQRFREWIERARSQPSMVPKPTSVPLPPGKKVGRGYVSSVQVMRARGESPEEIVHRIDRTVRIGAGVLAKGAATSMIVAGVGGTGKTYLVGKTLGKENEGKTWVTYSGNMTPLSLYAFLFKHRHDKVLVFDDVDVWKDIGMVNMFKSALDDKPNRSVSWSSTGRTVSMPKNIDPQTWLMEKEDELNDLISKGKEDKWKGPNNFDFTSRVIFITNKPMKQIMDDPHIGAVASRALFRIDYDFDDQLILAKMASTWEHVAPHLPLKERRQVYEIIKQGVQSGRIRNVSMRMLNNAFALLGALRGGEADPIKMIKQLAEDGQL